MTPERIADIQARASGRETPWTEAAIAAQLARPEAILASATHAFAMGRLLADEAELLLIATDPSHQRQGQGQSCLAAFEALARERQAVCVFLEVAASNDAARALYEACGYRQIGRREGYYTQAHGAAEAAILMRRDLQTA